MMEEVKEKMKEKAVMVMDIKPKTSKEEAELTAAATESASRLSCFSSRNPFSKYDFVKVKVWLGDNADHYYVLSRFLLSRMLTVTKIPNHVAIKIALELKKLLVDNSLLDVSQSDLEANLFKLMERRGFGEEYINRYKMMTRFHHLRVPLVILVCGTACSGKSTIATQLAQRLNLPNVLQTDMVYELLRTSTEAPLGSTPVWEREFSSSEELITEFCRECRIVRKGLAGDLKKAMKDGKPIIIEGLHLDPSIYLMDDENKLTIYRSGKAKQSKQGSDYPPSQKDNGKFNPYKFPSANAHHFAQNLNLEDASLSYQVNFVAASLESSNIEGRVSDGGTVRKPEKDNIRPFKKERSGVEPIIIPIVLKMTDFDHEALLEEWIASHSYKDNDRILSNIRTIQDYLCKFEAQGLTIVNISATTFPQTLDWLHNYLLQCIEQGISSVSDETLNQQAKK